MSNNLFWTLFYHIIELPFNPSLQVKMLILKISQSIHAISLFSLWLCLPGDNV